MNLTAYCQQPTKCDIKIDTFYCYGPSKARAIVKNELKVYDQDTTIVALQQQLLNCEFSGYEKELAVIKQNGTINAMGEQFQECEKSKKEKEQENNDLKKQIKRKNIFSKVKDIVIGVSLTANAILIFKK